MGEMKKLPLADSVRIIVRGAGGGGGSQRKPIESPDSLRSISYARIVDLISEGECFGWADPANPLACYYLNETPCANLDGSLNFKNLQIDSRTGTQTQDYLRGFPAVESESVVGVELRADTPWTRAFSNVNLTAVRVRLQVPIFQKTNTENGDITGTSVSYYIELSTDGGPFVTVLQGAFTGKTTTEYERGHRIDLPPATLGWTVRVSRTTPDSASGALQNATYVKGFTEIIDAKLRYPMSALVGTIIDAEQFNNIPARAFRWKGRLIRVPSNYNPDTGVYTGIWDGTFQTRYSNNPAWVFYDMATNTRYGLGKYVTQDLIDRWNLYRIAQYCDGLVSDGKGGLERRFTCNVYLQTRAEALKVMQDLASVFRGIMYYAAGAIQAVADMPEVPVYTYSQANVVDGKFAYSGTARKVRHTVALVSWNDMADMGRAKVEYIDDPEGIARYGIQETQVVAIGCTSQSQARRLGKYILTTERWETQSVTFSVGLDGVIAAPGKIIRVADPLRAGTRRSGRIVSATTLNIVLDKLPDAIAAGDHLICTMPNGVTEDRLVQSVNVGTRTVTVATAYSDFAVPESIWTVESASLTSQLFRVVATKEVEDGNGYSISAIQHVEGKFGYVEDGIKIDNPPISQLPSRIVPSPQNLQCEQREIRDQNSVFKNATLSWDVVPVASLYNVQYRMGQGTWIDLGNSATTNREILNILPGPFEVQVVAINSMGVRSLPTFGGPYDMAPITNPPIFVDDLQQGQDQLQDDLAQEVIDRTNAILAEQTARIADVNQEAADRAAALLNERLITEAAITAEATLRQTTDESLANQINSIVAGSGEQFDGAKIWYFDTDAEGFTGFGGSVSVTEGWLKGPDGTDVGVISPTYNIDGEKYRSTKMRVRREGTPTWDGRLYWRIGAAAWSTGNSVTVAEPDWNAEGIAAIDFNDVPWPIDASSIRIDLITVQDATNYVEFDWVAVGRPAPGASMAALQDEAQARTTADLAEATARGTLAAQLRGSYTGNDINALTQGLVFQERQARVTADSAMAANITSLQSRMTNAETDIDATSTAVDVLETRVDDVEGDLTTQASQITGLNSRLTTAEGTIGTQSAAIGSLTTRVTNAEGSITTNANAITSLNSSIGIIGDPKPNLVKNPSGAYGTQGWAILNGTEPFLAIVSTVNGNYFATDNVVTGPVAYYYDTAAAAGNVYSLAMDLLFPIGGTGTPAFRIDWYNGSSYISSSVTAQYTTPNAAFLRKALNGITAPAGTTRALLVVQYPSGSAPQLAWRRVKFEISPAATPYTDEGAVNANATATTALETRVSTAEGNITANSASITSLNSSIAGKADVSAVTALTTRVTQVETSGNVNLLGNTTFQNNIQGWNGAGDIFNRMARDMHGWPWQPKQAHALVVAGNTGGTPGASFFGASSVPLRVPVIGGQIYIASAWIAGHRCNGGMQIYYYDQNDTLIAVAAMTEIVLPQAGTEWSGYTRAFVMGQAPANAKWSSILVYGRDNGTATSEPYLWIIRPMMELARPGQTAPTAWNTGGLEMSAQYSLNLNVNGYVTGFQVGNDGTTGNMTIVADNFAIVSPSGGARTEYSGGNWRVYDAGGVLRVRMGIW